MQPDSSTGLVLSAVQRGGSRALAAEEGADFDLTVRNESGRPQTLRSLENEFTPVYKLVTSAGSDLEEFTARQRTLRVVGDIGSPEFGAPEEVTLDPGESQNSVIRAWGFREPLPPGTYGFEAAHEPFAGASKIQSNRVAFEIRRARVEDMALAMDSPARTNSVLAWLARVDGSAGLRLLIRQSGFTSHRAVQVGGLSHGAFPEGSRVGLAVMPIDATFPPLNWAAVVSGAQLQMIQHSMGVAHWRAPMITLPVSGAVPVQRFPNRRHAVFLATANAASGPVLIGSVVHNGAAASVPWVVHLRGIPVHAACAFSMDGAISVLYSTDDGPTSRLHLLSVSENGEISTPDAVVRESPNDIRSITADMRVGAPISFVVAEEARELPDNLAFVRVGLEGSVMATGLREVAGWPTITDTRGAQVPERAISVSIDLDAKGIPWIAIVTETAGFVGGRLDGPLHLLRGPLGHRNVWPHVAGLADSMALSCFDETGMLFHYRPGPDDQ